MREIFEQYGKCVLEGLICITLLSIVFVGVTDECGNRGIYAIVGAQIDTKSIDYRIYKDMRETFKEESEKSPPCVCFNGSRLEIGSHVLNDYIKALDYEGKELSLTIQSIKDSSDVEWIESYCSDTGIIYFSRPGVYRICVCAIDEGNRLTEVVIQVPVNQKKRCI